MSSEWGPSQHAEIVAVQDAFAQAFQPHAGFVVGNQASGGHEDVGGAGLANEALAGPASIDELDDVVAARAFDDAARISGLELRYQAGE